MVVGYIKAAYRGWKAAPTDKAAHTDKAAPTDMEYNYFFVEAAFQPR